MAFRSGTRVDASGRRGSSVISMLRIIPRASAAKPCTFIRMPWPVVVPPRIALASTKRAMALAMSATLARSPVGRFTDIW